MAKLLTTTIYGNVSIDSDAELRKNKRSIPIIYFFSGYNSNPTFSVATDVRFAHDTNNDRFYIWVS